MIVRLTTALLIFVIAIGNSAYRFPDVKPAENISFYCKWKIRYQENSGTNTKTFYFVSDVKTMEGNLDCLNYKVHSDLNDKVHEQVAYYFPELTKQSGWHNLDGGKLGIEVVSDESKNEVDRLRRNDITALRDRMKGDDKLNNFVFDLDDLSCD